MTSLTFEQGGADPPLWAFLLSKTPRNHILDQDLLFVAIPVINNFERVKINSNLLTSSQSGTGLTSVGPHKVGCKQ